MSDRPVNLNPVRKQKERAAQKARAEENATRFGRSKAQKQLEETQAEKARRLIDLHRREDD